MTLVPVWGWLPSVLSCFYPGANGVTKITQLQQFSGNFTLLVLLHLL